MSVGRQRPDAAAGRAPSLVLVTALAAAFATVLTACGGSSPAYSFVANTDRTVVVRIPGSWSQLDTKKILPAGSTADSWAAFYDAAKTPSPSHAFRETPAAAITAPVLRLASFKLPSGAAAGLTDDDLRDLFLPASGKGVQQLANHAQLDAEPEIAFKSFGEEKINKSTAHGLRLLYAYDFGKGPTVHEKVAVLDPKGTHLHGIDISCSPQCFTAHREEIDAVIASFTVKPAG